MYLLVMWTLLMFEVQPSLLYQNETTFKTSGLGKFENSWSKLGLSAAVNKTQDLNEDYKEKLRYTPDTWIQDVLLWHNKLRARHGICPVELDYKLCYEAEQHALELSWITEAAGELRLEGFMQSQINEGQNEGGKCQGSRSELDSLHGKLQVQTWYQSITSHEYSKESQLTSNQFSQIIWAATTRIGCGRVVSYNGCLLNVCRYFPRGNIPCSFKMNVNRPISGDPNAIPDFENL